MRDQCKAFCWMCLAAVLVTALPVVAAPEQSQQAPPEQALPESASAAVPPEPVPDEAAETAERAGQKSAMDEFRALSAERRDEAIAAAGRAAADLDREMARLQQQMDQGWERMSQATRERSQAAMADLRHRRNTLAEWFGGMRHGSTAAWAEVRGGFANSYQELAEALRKARAEFARQAQDEQMREADDPGSDQSR